MINGVSFDSVRESALFRVESKGKGCSMGYNGFKRVGGALAFAGELAAIIILPSHVPVHTTYVKVTNV